MRPIHWILALAAVIAGGATFAHLVRRNSEPAPAATAPRAAQHIIVVFDNSVGRKPLVTQAAVQLVPPLCEELSFDDEIRFEQVHARAADDGSFEWHARAPRPRNPTFATRRERDDLSGWLRGAKDVVPILGATPAPRTTDLFSTLAAIQSDVADAATRRTRLILLSDMEQSNGKIEFAGGRSMPSHRWIDRQAAKGLLPRLSSVCVVVVGADPSAKGGAAIRQFWHHYFQATGAVLLDRNYVPTAINLAHFDCGDRDRSASSVASQNETAKRASR